MRADEKKATRSWIDVGPCRTLALLERTTVPAALDALKLGVMLQGHHASFTDQKKERRRKTLLGCGADLSCPWLTRAEPLPARSVFPDDSVIIT